MSDKCGPAKCTNKGCNPEKKPETCAASSGFFSKLFGGGGAETTDTSCGRCQDCGMEKCNCNCALREHLKQCCGYGTLPKLIDNCDAVNPPKKKEDPCATTKSTCGAPVVDKCAPVVDKCAPVVDKCAPPPKVDKCASTCDDGPKEKAKCPPMPCTDTTGCIPTWLCPPTSSGVKHYPGPAGVKIYPISVGGRKHQGYYDPSGTCGACGSGSSGPAPKVSKDCPMVKPRCGGTVAEAKIGIIARIKNFFGIGK